MCLANADLNKTLVCTVIDLKPGDRFRTPDGRTLLVVAGIANPIDTNAGVEVPNIDPYTKLGRDRQDRLYASRYLNPPAQTECKHDTGN